MTQKDYIIERERRQMAEAESRDPGLRRYMALRRKRLNTNTKEGVMPKITKTAEKTPAQAPTPTPGEDDIIVSYSELDTFRQCPLKHAWSYKDRWRSPNTSKPLALGSLVHTHLESYYNSIVRKESTDQAVLEIQQELGVYGNREQTEYERLASWILTGYDEYYREQDQGVWEPLEAEYAFVVPLPDEDGTPVPGLWLKGKVDLVARHVPSGRIWIWDHKTGAYPPDQMALEIDDQFGLYTWALRWLGWPVAGSIHNYLKSKPLKGDETGKTPTPLDKRFQRTYLNRTDVELNNIALDASRAAQAAHSGAALYSAPDPRQCGWKCDYKEQHVLVRKGASVGQAMTDYGFVQDFTRH